MQMRQIFKNTQKKPSKAFAATKHLKMAKSSQFYRKKPKFPTLSEIGSDICCKSDIYCIFTGSSEKSLDVATVA